MFETEESLSNKDDDELEKNNEEEDIFNGIPVNYAEYIKYYGLEDWPVRMTSERVLNLREELPDYQDIDIIFNILQDDVDINFDRITDLENERLNQERELLEIAKDIVDVDKILTKATSDNAAATTQSQLPDNLKEIVKKVQETSPRVAAYRQALNSKEKTATSLNKSNQSLRDTNQKCVELYNFEGYKHDSFTELPKLVDVRYQAFIILKKVRISKSLRTVFKNLFSSETSIAVMVDTFWWIYLKFFKDEFVEDKEKFFARIALDFGILFLNIPDQVKDGFLKIYPETVAMVIYSLFYKSFPDSRRLFGPEFKQQIINTCHFWITGITPLPNSFNSWPTELLESGKDDQLKEAGDNMAKESIKPMNNIPSGFLYSKTLFNSNSRSPLIMKFLQIYDVHSGVPKPAHLIQWTNVEEKKISQTYLDQHENQTKEWKERKSNFKELEEERNNEMKEMKKRQKQLEERFDRLQKELDACDSVYDMKNKVNQYVSEDYD